MAWAVRLSVVCNVGAPYSEGRTFRHHLIVYGLGHFVLKIWKENSKWSWVTVQIKRKWGTKIDVFRTVGLSRFISTSSSAVAKRPRDAPCLSVVSFNIPIQRSFLLLVTAASDLLVHKILLNSVLLSPIVSGGVRPKLPGQTPLVFCRSWVGWGPDPTSWVG